MRASLSAEAKTQKYQQPAWSLALSRARARVSVLTKCLLMIRTRLDCSAAIHSQLSNGLFSDNLVPSNKQECVQQLRNARREVQKIIQETFARREEEQQAKIQELEDSARRSDQSQAKFIRRIKRAEALNI